MPLSLASLCAFDGCGHPYNWHLGDGSSSHCRVADCGCPGFLGDAKANPNRVTVEDREEIRNALSEPEVPMVQCTAEYHGPAGHFRCGIKEPMNVAHQQDHEADDGDSGKFCWQDLVATYPVPPRFQTKDSGVRAAFASGMVRDTNEGKARFELLWPKDVPYAQQFMTRVAELLGRGAAKYEDRNWEKATGEAEIRRFEESALRHMMQWLAGETDEDHAAAVVFNLLGAETTKWKRDNGQE